jgi:hypothetical protein
LANAFAAHFGGGPKDKAASPAAPKAAHSTINDSGFRRLSCALDW